MSTERLTPEDLIAEFEERAAGAHQSCGPGCCPTAISEARWQGRGQAWTEAAKLLRESLAAAQAEVEALRADVDRLRKLMAGQWEAGRDAAVGHLRWMAALVETSPYVADVSRANALHVAALVPPRIDAELPGKVGGEPVAATGQYVEGWRDGRDAAAVAADDGPCGCPFAPCEHDAMRVHIVSRIRALAPPAQPGDCGGCMASFDRDLDGPHHGERCWRFRPAQPVEAAPLSPSYLVRNAPLVDGSDTALKQRQLCARVLPSAEQVKAEPVRPLVYLACPYSHPDRAVRVARFEAVNRAAGDLMRAGAKVFSPISHTHPIAEAGDLPLGWDYWEAFDRAYLAASHRVVVLRLPGWETSKGVAAEIAIAREMGLPVEYVEAAPPKAEELVVCDIKPWPAHVRDNITPCINPRPAPEGSTK